jgi:hypothetical protein
MTTAEEYERRIRQGIEIATAPLNDALAQLATVTEGNYALAKDNMELREALVRLRDCDWTISLPDRMDAVRDIARAAIDSAKGQ